MSRNTLFMITVIIVGSLAAYVSFEMFSMEASTDLRKSQMYFGASVLAFLAFIFLLSIVVYALGPESSSGNNESPGKVIFDSCVKIIPPLVTLIVGFYFGTHNVQSPNQQQEPAAVVRASPSSGS